MTAEEFIACLCLFVITGLLCLIGIGSFALAIELMKWIFR